MKDGGPAFPRPPAWSPGYEPNCVRGQDGMSLLDWFAGMAMPTVARSFADCDSKYAGDVAEISYEFAAAMLAERERRLKAANEA